jgi:hypothetical protein
MAQNKVTNDDNIVSVLDCVDENLSEVESSNSHNEICNNQEYDHESGTQTLNKVMHKQLQKKVTNKQLQLLMSAVM